MIYHKPYYHKTSKEWIILIHGVGGSSSVWFKQIRDYKKSHNVLLVDLRGHGKSQSYDNKGIIKYSFQDISKDVIEVMDHLSIPQGHFVGISLGTIVIRTISELAPERVSSMIMGGAVTRLNTRSKILMKIADLFKKYVPFMWLYSFYAFILMPRKHHKESRNLFIREAKRLARKEIMRWFTLTAQVNPLLKYFREKDLSIPTLYVMGEQDYMFLPQVKRLVKKHKASILQVLEECGHVVNVEQPAVFNQLSLAFIENQNS